MKKLFLALSLLLWTSACSASSIFSLTPTPTAYIYPTAETPNIPTLTVEALGNAEYTLPGFDNALYAYQFVNGKFSRGSDSSAADYASLSLLDFYAFGDLNKDGVIEIITAGYAGNLNNSKGQLCVWHWTGQELILKAAEQWQNLEGYALTISGSVQGNTMVNSVKSADLDGDGLEEIVTGGSSFDGANVTAQVGIWGWNNETLTLRENKEWASDYLNEVKCVSLGNVDGDSKIDVVTSGAVCSKGSFSGNATVSEMAQLRVWGWDGGVLTLKYDMDWVTDEGVCAWNVATADLNNDGSKEIISVGCSYLSDLCDPDMRIWSIPVVNSKNADSFPTFYIVIATGAIALAVAATVAFRRLKKK